MLKCSSFVSYLLNFASSLCERRSFDFKALDLRVDRLYLKSSGDKEARTELRALWQDSLKLRRGEITANF